MRKHRDETSPSGGEIAEKRLYGAVGARIGMVPAERSSMKVYMCIWYVCDRRIPGRSYDKLCLRELSNQVIAATLWHVHF